MKKAKRPESHPFAPGTQAINTLEVCRQLWLPNTLVKILQSVKWLFFLLAVLSGGTK